MTDIDDTMTDPETQQYLDQEYPTDLAAKLRGHKITPADPLPAWAVRELEQNLDEHPSLVKPGDLLADRNPAAYASYIAARDEIRKLQGTLTFPSDDDLVSRCKRAANSAVEETLENELYRVEQAYIAAVREGKK